MGCGIAHFGRRGFDSRRHWNPLVPRVETPTAVSPNHYRREFKALPQWVQTPTAVSQNPSCAASQKVSFYVQKKLRVSPIGELWVKPGPKADMI